MNARSFVLLNTLSTVRFKAFTYPSNSKTIILGTTPQATCFLAVKQVDQKTRQRVEAQLNNVPNPEWKHLATLLKQKRDGFCYFGLSN